MELANGGFDEIKMLPSQMKRDIDKILSTRKYKDLSYPYRCHEAADYKKIRSTNLTKKVIAYCTLLKNLLKDDALWDNLDVSGDHLYISRLQYELFGNVLKAIFVIHEKSKQQFLAYFEKLYVKIFTFPKSGQKVKVVVLKPIKNGQQVIDNLRLPLQGLRTRRSASRVPTNVSESDQVSESLLNNSGKVSREVQPVIQDVPTAAEIPVIHFTNEDVPMFMAEVPSYPPQRKPVDENLTAIDLEEQQRRWELAHQIGVFQKEPETSRVSSRPSVSDPTGHTSLRNSRGYREIECERLITFARECGCDTTGYENIQDPEELKRIIEEDTMISSIPRIRTTGVLSDESDDIPCIFQTKAEIHPIPAQFRTPEYVPQILEAEGTLYRHVQTTRVSPVIDERTSIIQTRAEVHPIPVEFQTPAHVPQIVETEGTLLSHVQTARVSPITDTQIFQTRADVHPIPDEFRIPEHVPQMVEAEGTLLSHVQTARVSSVIDKPVDAHTAIGIDELALIRPVPENILVEQVDRTCTQIEEQNREMITARQTIADLLIQGSTTEREVPAEIMKAIEQRGSILELPLHDIPVNLEQMTTVRSTPRPISDLWKEDEETILPVRKTRVRKKNPPFYGTQAMNNRLNRIIKPQTYISHAERLANSVELLRHPYNRFLPFDEYESNEKNIEFIRRFDVVYDELPTCSNMLDDLLCGLFEQVDDMYIEDNEFEMRIENLRESARFSLQPSVRQSLNIFQNEEPPHRNLQQIDNIMPAIQVQAPIEDNAQIPAQISINLPRIEAISSKTPLAEPRASIRSSQAGLRRTQGSPFIEGPSQRPLQSTDNNMTELLRHVLRVPESTESNLQIPARSSINIPQTEDISLKTPAQEVPSILSRPSMLQPPEVIVGEIIEQEKVTEVVVPQRRLRRTLRQGIVDIAQIPDEFQLQQREQTSMVPRTDLITEIVPHAELHQTSILPQTGPVVEIAPLAVPIQESFEEYIAPKRSRIRINEEDVMNMLAHLWAERSAAPVCFTALCPRQSTDKFTTACVFGILLSLGGRKMMDIDQERKNFNPKTIWISLPGCMSSETDDTDSNFPGFAIFD